MAFAHGKSTVFKTDNAGGSLTDISAYLDNVDFPQSVDTAETTTFGKSAKTYIGGLKDGTISISGSWDGANSAVDDTLSGIVGQTGSFEYGPGGSANGAIKYTGEAICTSYQITGSVGDKVTFSAEFQTTGGISRGTYSS